MRNIIEENPEVKVMWYLRLANTVIDFIAIMAFLIVLGLFAGLLTHFDIYGPAEWIGGMSDLGYRLLFTVTFFLYYSLMEGLTQRTLGKLITGTMVVTEDGSKPQLKSILGRSLCRIFSIEAFSFLAEYPRGWHDSASGTYVVKVKKLKEIIALEKDFGQIGITAEENTSRWGS